MSLGNSAHCRTLFAKAVLLALLASTGCSEWRATRNLRASEELRSRAEEAFLRGEDLRARELYKRTLLRAQEAEHLTQRKPVQDKASEIASDCQRHLSMFGNLTVAGETILACLKTHHAELSHYLDFSTIANDILPEGRGEDVSWEDRLSMIRMFASFMTYLMSSGNPFEFATCEVVEGEQTGERTLCHVTCRFAGVESSISFAFGKSRGGRWLLRDFIIHGLGVSCMSAFRDAVIAMEQKVPYDALAQGQEAHMKELENVYHRLTDKGGDEVIYQSLQGRQVEIIEETEVLDDEETLVGTAHVGEIFSVVREVMKEGDILWLLVQLDRSEDEANTGWILKDAVKAVPLAEEEVWGLL